MAYLGAVAVEEGDGEDLVLERLLASFLEGGDRQHQHDDRAGDADVQPLAGEFGCEPLRPADGQPVGRAADAFIGLAGAMAGRIERGTDPRIHTQREALQAGRPAGLPELHHGSAPP